MTYTDSYSPPAGVWVQFSPRSFPVIHPHSFYTLLLFSTHQNNNYNKKKCPSQLFWKITFLNVNNFFLHRTLFLTCDRKSFRLRTLAIISAKRSVSNLNEHPTLSFCFNLWIEQIHKHIKQTSHKEFFQCHICLQIVIKGKHWLSETHTMARTGCLTQPVESSSSFCFF